MIVDLAKLGNKKTDFELVIEPSEINLESEFVNLKNPIKFIGKLQISDLRVEVEGKISAELDLSCNRCLQPVSQKINLAFENAFVTAENYTEEQEIELEIKDLEVSILEGEKIDLKEVAREQVLLALPTQVLCKKDCEGLCEECGANLNSADCSCKKDEVDPRWSALKNLKIKNKK